jgi:four helix bundle protein
VLNAPSVGQVTKSLVIDITDQAFHAFGCNHIAEGCGKRGNGDFQRFLGIAAGSASEVEYHFLLAHDLGFLDGDQYKSLDTAVVEVKRMLASLIIKVESDRRAS